MRLFFNRQKLPQNTPFAGLGTFRLFCKHLHSAIKKRVIDIAELEQRPVYANRFQYFPERN